MSLMGRGCMKSGPTGHVFEGSCCQGMDAGMIRAEGEDACGEDAEWRSNGLPVLRGVEVGLEGRLV